MKFSNFLLKIDELKFLPLGKQEAQFKLAPALRLAYNEDKIKALKPKKAAVLALFYPDNNNETTFLLTERASYNGTHSAQISFPGGKLDKLDKSLKETALREAYEEVGIHKSDIEIIREITDVFIPPSNFLATPFMGYIKSRPSFIKNHEVANTIEVKLHDLLDDTNLNSILIDTSYMDRITVPCFKLNNYVVWGATGMMLSEIKELIKEVLN